MTKTEKKLLKAAKKLEEATQNYMETLEEIDKVFQKLPTKITRRYLLEDRYFKFIPRIASASIRLELLSSYLEGEMLHSNDDIDDINSWADLKWEK